LLQSQHDELTC